MKILIVGLKTNDQALRVIEEGQKKGHTVDAVLSSELIINADHKNFTPSLKNNDITSYDLIYLWAVSKRRWEWYTAALWLNKNYKTKIVYSKVIDPSYNYFLTSAIDFWKLSEEGLLFPKSAVIFSKSSVDNVADQFSFPVILRGMPGRKGLTVSKLNSTDEVKDKIDEMKDSCDAFSLREFIPNDGDIRVFTVGYKAIGAMKRTPKEGDFRSNISQGGSGEEFDLNSNPEVRKVAERAAELMRTEIAGVDIMLHAETGKPYILEINPGPQFTGLEQYTNINAAGEIIKYFETL